MTIRSPVMITDAGFSRFALAIASSKFTVSCANHTFEVKMPGCRSDIWMNVCAAAEPANAHRQENPS